jgi:hypothetical protein
VRVWAELLPSATASRLSREWAVGLASEAIPRTLQLKHDVVFPENILHDSYIYSGPGLCL